MKGLFEQLQRDSLLMAYATTGNQHFLDQLETLPKDPMGLNDIPCRVSADLRAHEAAQELGRLLVAGAAPWLPDVPIKTEPLLMRRWSKLAKPVFKEGRLAPCE